MSLRDPGESLLTQFLSVLQRPKDLFCLFEPLVFLKSELSCYYTVTVISPIMMADTLYSAFNTGFSLGMLRIRASVRWENKTFRDSFIYATIHLNKYCVSQLSTAMRKPREINSKERR